MLKSKTVFEECVVCVASIQQISSIIKSLNCLLCIVHRPIAYVEIQSINYWQVWLLQIWPDGLRIISKHDTFYLITETKPQKDSIAKSQQFEIRIVIVIKFSEAV